MKINPHHIKNIWDAAKTMLRGELISINSYVRKEEISQIKIESFYLMNTQKRRANCPNQCASRLGAVLQGKSLLV